MDISTVFATSDSSTGMSATWIVIAAVAAVIGIIAFWRVFKKAGQPGWAAIIPIYNTYIILKIVGRPAWWLLLYLIPFVNLIVSIVVSIDMAKVFGKSTAFGVFGLWLFSVFGYLILGYGDATYKGAIER